MYLPGSIQFGYSEPTPLNNQLGDEFLYRSLCLRALLLDTNNILNSTPRVSHRVFVTCANVFGRQKRLGAAQKHTRNGCTVPSHPPLTLDNRSCHGVGWGVGCGGRVLWPVSRPLSERRGPFCFLEPISIYTKTSVFFYVQRYLVHDMPSPR
jgi:hypothetical protein